ncbi:MAG TPA: hypothetical protein VHM30_02200 [Gemmatimonadaceae bacterium]|nr:hypothetical protein [Gemmatimonadaceae bacterium]
MKRNFVLITGALMASALTLQAQSGQCTSGTGVQRNACHTAVDLFDYMAPQLGAVIAGGNTTLGQGGSMGGLGHFAISVRGNALMGSVPQMQNYNPLINNNPTNAGSQTIATKDQVLGLPAVDAAIGIFPGLDLGVTRVGGIDALVNAYYIPEYSGQGVTVKAPDGSLKFGYGVRVGVLEEGIVTPGLGFSFVKRDLPTVDIHAQSGLNSFDVKGLDVNTTSWRVTASKSLVVLGLAVGAGQDKYESAAAISGSVSGFAGTSASGKQSLTRTNYFADVSMNLMLAKLVAEIGSVSGGDVQTYNTFSGKAADASRLYGSLGLRLGF